MRDMAKVSTPDRLRALASSPSSKNPRSIGSSTPLRELGTGKQIVAGTAGDHALVLDLLCQVYQCSLSEDFQSRLDEPSYEPCDRLLLVHEGQLLGHVQVSKQIGWFQQQRCPLAKLQEFVTLPEYSDAKCTTALLQIAEATAAREGSILGLVRTDRPEWFRQHGWSHCRGQGHTRANTRSILSHFDFQRAGPRRKKTSIEVRTWRHFEIDSLRCVYQQLSTNMWGALQRSDLAWQWLMGRKAHDQVLMAVKRGSVAPTTTHAGSAPHVVGYAVVRDSCIVEMLTLPGYSSARSLLVVQACRDAIDRDHYFVALHTPAADPMHELLVTAGGSWVGDTAANGRVWMIKLLAPDRWVERLYPVLHQRAHEAGISSPQQFDLAVANADYRLMLTRRSSRLESVSRQPPQARCGWNTFQDLLTSNLILSDAVADGRLRSAHPGIVRTLAELFPPKLFWQSPFELLRL